MKPIDDYRAAAERLQDLLGLSVPPLAITFADSEPEGIPAYGAAHPEPTADGRTGSVPAGCVFWIKSTDRTFATRPEDHGNCSVGSLTHGFKTLAEASGNADVAALVESDWVTPDVFPQIPTVRKRPAAVVYGPLRDTPIVPDVVFLRLNGKQAMMLHDAWPGLRFEGKPQCHIIPIALENDEVAVSVGCMLSRVRTGMSNTEVTCAIPAARLEALIAGLDKAIAADQRVAAYAAADSKRFG